MDNTIFNNGMLILPLISWFVAQVFKVLFHLHKYKKLDVKRFIGSGGMPSAHTAFVSCLATSVGLHDGWASSTFAIASAFTLVVMYDAAGVRRAAGKQASVINKMIEEFNSEGKLDWNVRLKEFIGHTPMEVFAGVIVGITIGFLFGTRI